MKSKNKIQGRYCNGVISGTCCENINATDRETERETLKFNEHLIMGGKRKNIDNRITSYKSDIWKQCLG